MKLLLAALLATVTAGAVPKPYRHAQHHVPRRVIKRDPVARPAAVYEPVPVETVVVYELNGLKISEDDVRQGIANGTLMWGDDGNLSTTIANSPVVLATPPPEPQTQGNIRPTPEPHSLPPPSPSQADTPSPSATPEPLPSAPTESNAQEQPAQSGSYQPVNKDGYCADCEKEFLNGKYSCDQFPTGYGAVHLSNEGLGGWTGIQDPGERGDAGYNRIMTVPKGSCKDGSCCTPGRFCSYACPNPYLKNSFPKKQGADGQSVGGLYCNEDGKLEMADGSVGNTLCSKGSDKMTVRVENKLSKSVSICRTDYPGTESETQPLTVGPGQSGLLANPDQSKYYFWQNKATSAHYYINKQGVPESEACTWGTGSRAVGNWAPTIFGTSWDDRIMNTGFSGLFQNELCPNEKLDFTITFTGDDTTSPCKYKSLTGQYCQNDNCGPDVSCTASTKEGGTLTLVFTDN